MEESISAQIWIIATLFGGIGAAVLQFFVSVGKHFLSNKKAKRLLRRETSFNLKQIEKILNELNKLKEDYIKLDRSDTYFHYFTLKSSQVVLRALINLGTVYDYLDDEQLVKLDDFVSENTQFLNDQVQKIREAVYNKKEAAEQVDFFIRRYNTYKSDLESVLQEI